MLLFCKSLVNCSCKLLIFFFKSTTLNLRQMDSTGRHYLSMNDRLFCMCVFQDLFQVGEIIEAPSHAKLEVVQSWTLSPLTSQRPQFNHFPSRRCVQVVLGNARLSLPPVFPPDVSWMKSHLIQMKFFLKTQGCGVHVFDGLSADYVGGWAWSRAICCEQMKVAL